MSFFLNIQKKVVENKTYPTFVVGLSNEKTDCNMVDGAFRSHGNAFKYSGTLLWRPFGCG